MGYAKYVGRVGALAIALGIGSAVAETPSMAWATTDDGGSASAASTDAGSADKSDTPSAEGSRSADADTPSSSQNIASNSGSTSDGADGDDETDSGTSIPDANSDQLDADEPRDQSDNDAVDSRTDETPDTARHNGKVEIDQPAAAPANDRHDTAADDVTLFSDVVDDPAGPAAPAVYQTLVVNTASDRIPAVSEVSENPLATTDPEPATKLASVATAVATALLDSGGPADIPTDSPAEWVLLAAARRDLSDPETTNLNLPAATLTNQTSAAPFSLETSAPEDPLKVLISGIGAVIGTAISLVSDSLTNAATLVNAAIDLGAEAVEFAISAGIELIAGAVHLTTSLINYAVTATVDAFVDGFTSTPTALGNLIADTLESLGQAVTTVANLVDNSVNTTLKLTGAVVTISITVLDVAVTGAIALLTQAVAVGLDFIAALLNPALPISGPVVGAVPFSLTVDPVTGIVNGHVNVTSTAGLQLTYALPASIDPTIGDLVVNVDTGDFSFIPTPQTRFYAATTSEDDTLQFAIDVTDGQATVSVIVNAPISPHHPDDDGVLSLAELDTLAGFGAVQVSESEYGTINAIIGAFTDNKIIDSADALAALNRIAQLLGAPGSLSGEIDTQSADFDDPTALTEMFYRLNQTINGIPVLGGDVVLSTFGDGTATGVFSGIDPAVYQVNTTPGSTIDDADKAIDTAKQILANFLTDNNGDPLSEGEQEEFLASLTFDAQLVIYGLDPQASPALAWLVDAHTAPESADYSFAASYFLYANGANAGALLAQNDFIANGWTSSTETANGLPHGNQSMTYTFTIQRNGNDAEMVDQGRNILIYNGQKQSGPDSAGKIQTWATTSSQNIAKKGYFGWDQSAVSAMANMATVRDYYKSVLGWDFKNALPDAHGIRVAIVDSGLTGIAQWNYGLQSFGFGEDTEAALDAVGHEYTHAVIQSILTSSRSWAFTGAQGEALNEAYGDIIGGLIEGKTNAGRWLVGEDADGNTWRDMLNPSQSPYNDAANYSQFDPSKSAHYNATIFDHAAYLMMGGPNKATGVSNNTWAKVFYGSMRRLPVNATFQDARNAVVSSAIVNGLNTQQVKAIEGAFTEVGITQTRNVKIVLTWGASPSDLDSHLTGPSSVAGLPRFHVYYGNPNYFQNGGMNSDPLSDRYRLSVDLDYDDTSSFGPEGTTIRNLVAGDYYFYVRDFSNGGSTDSTALGRSGATVTVTDSARRGSPTVFRVDGSVHATTWTVFKLTISGAATNRTVTITPINAYSYDNVYV